MSLSLKTFFIFKLDCSYMGVLGENIFIEAEALSITCILECSDDD